VSSRCLPAACEPFVDADDVAEAAVAALTERGHWTLTAVAGC
jgi:hypothetical protein